MSGTLLPPGKITFFDDNGLPLAGGQVFYYQPGTFIPQTTWQNQTLTQANTNPVQLDGAGRASIYGTGPYRQIVQDKYGKTIWDQVVTDPGVQAPVQTVANLVGLRAITTYPQTQVVAVQGATYPADGSWAFFYWNAASTTPDNGTTVIQPNNVIPGQPGRWLAFATPPSTTGSTIPIGTIVAFAGSTAPTGWQLCQGQAVSRTTYANTYAVLGNTFGAGDGSTTFNLPDLRGRVPAGVDDGAGRLTSDSIGSAAVIGVGGGSEDIPEHTHSITVVDGGHVHSIAPQGYSYDNSDPGAARPPAVAGATAGASYGPNTQLAYTGITVSAQTTGVGFAQNVQPILVVNWLIYAPN